MRGFRRFNEEKCDIGVLASALDDIRKASSPEARLRAAELFATQLEEARAALDPEKLELLRSDLENLITEVKRSRDDLSEEIAATASRIERLRGGGKCGVGGLGGGSTGSLV